MCVCVCLYTHIHIYSAIKRNEIMPFAATCMDLEIVIYSEVSLKEKDKYCIVSLICGSRKIVQMNLFAKQK